MSEPVIYLFVGRDGTEYVSNEEPKRAVPYIIAHAPEQAGKFTRSREYALQSYYKSDTETGWFTSISSCDYGSYVPGEDFWFDAVELPHGTIKKLTGRDIGFWDEPIRVEPVKQHNNG